MDFGQLVPFQRGQRIIGVSSVAAGNINSKGERIYHTPWGSRSYDRTEINSAKGERWFCDEAEAVAAGWRAPRN